jgi:putative flippase GtrA
VTFWRMGVGRGGIGRATLSSVVATVCDFGAFSVLVSVGMVAPVATLCGCAVGALVNFIVNRYWAFERCGSWLKAALRYAAVSGTSALANALLVAVATTGLGMSARSAWALARCLVFLGLTYPLFRGWVFGSKDPLREAEPGEPRAAAAS